MIYTLTFSPALDYIVDLDNLAIGEINRSTNEKIIPGGKGINVSFVLANLGTPSIAMGFLGGFTGEYIKNVLESKNINTDFVQVSGNTRINVKIKGKVETAINGQGPKISKENFEELVDKLSFTIKDGDYLVISGAIPSFLPSDTYEKILERIKNKSVHIIIDTEKDKLLNTLKYHPLLVKPNLEELEEICGYKIKSLNELQEETMKLLQLGAINVIVSLGGDGAFMMGENIGPIKIDAPKGKVVNTVGAGDSLVAGFLDEFIRSKELMKSFKRGVACGSASAFSFSLATKEEVEKLLKLM